MSNFSSASKKYEKLKKNACLNIAHCSLINNDPARCLQYAALLPETYQVIMYKVEANILLNQMTEAFNLMSKLEPQLEKLNSDDQVVSYMNTINGLLSKEGTSTGAPCGDINKAAVFHLNMAAIQCLTGDMSAAKVSINAALQLKPVSNIEGQVLPPAYLHALIYYHLRVND